MEGKYLKRAAVLPFHEDPDRFITGAFVKIGFFVSESDLAYHDEIHGSLFSQAHASHPYNPDVANAFFRSGEIESWGRGIEKIFSTCRKADSPPPEIHVDGYDLWVEFGFSPQYMAAIQGEIDSNKSTAQKTAQKILEILMCQRMSKVCVLFSTLP